MTQFSLDALDLAALLSSRVCHDVISPVGAIVNGLEVLEEENDPEMRGHALALIKSSANEASSRLQFCRLAFGAAGSKGASIDTGDAELVTRQLLADERTKLNWSVPRVLMSKNKVKVLLIFACSPTQPFRAAASSPSHRLARKIKSPSVSKRREQTRALQRQSRHCWPARRKKAQSTPALFRPITPVLWRAPAILISASPAIPMLSPSRPGRRRTSPARRKRVMKPPMRRQKRWRMRHKTQSPDARLFS